MQFVATTFANFSEWYETNITGLNEDPKSEVSKDNKDNHMWDLT